MQIGKLPLGVIMAMAAVSPVWGADFYLDGLYYNKLSDSTVEVTYPTGAVEESGQYSDPNAYGSTYEGNIVIPETVENDKVTYTVVRIGDNAFRGAFVAGKAKDLLSVSIPETVTEIGYKAFIYRRTLKSVNIPSHLEKLGDYAFMLNQALASDLVLPGTLKNTGFQTFHSCGKIEQIKLEEGIEEIGRECFTYCSWLEYSDRANGVKFTTVPSTVKKIGTGAFTGCNYIRNFVVPDNVEWDENPKWQGFDGCQRLETVSLGTGIKSIGNYCFRGTLVKEFTVRTTVTYFDQQAFMECPNMEKIVIEPSETTLRGFSNRVWENSKKKLKTLHLGREVSPFMFSNQDELTDVTVLGDKVLETPTFPDAVYENAVLTVPAGMKAEFAAHEQWGKFKKITDGTEAWLEDVTFNCVADDGIIYVHPRRIAGLMPQFTPVDAATWNNVQYALTDAGTAKDDMIASLYTVNYWKPERVKFPELQGYRTGECKLTVTVTPPAGVTADPFVKEFTVKVVDPDRTERENGYVDGTIILNEEWFGHTNGSLNYLTEDDEVIYQAYERENPGMAFGATSQYGTIWGDKLIVASKQHADGGDPLIGGGRLVIADAKTLKRLGSLDYLKWGDEEKGGDGRAVTGATPNKIYVGTSAGIYVVSIADPTAPEVVGKIAAGSSDESDLYNGQVGDMVTTADHAYAIQQNTGVIIIDVNTDEVVKIIQDTNVQGITQSLDGRVWYATIDGDGCSNFKAIDPETLEPGETVVIPATFGRVTCGWGAWRSTQFFGSQADNELWFVTGGSSIAGGSNGGYFRYRIGDDPADLEPLFNLNDVQGETEFGETVNQMTYGTSRFDARNNRLIVLTTYKGAASGQYRENWIHYVDGTTGEITNTFHLEPYYWFQSLPIFPDKHDAELRGDKEAVEVTTDKEVDLRDYVTDADNLDANIRFAAAPEAAAEAGDAIAEFALNGSRLTVKPVKEGQTNFLFTAESNGRPVTLSLPVTVKNVTGIDDVIAAHGIVTVRGNRLYVNGYNGCDFNLYNPAGVCVASFTADSDDYVAEFSLAAGVYVLRGDNLSMKIALN